MPRSYRSLILAIGLILAGTNHAHAEGGAQKQDTQQAIAQSLNDIATANRQEAERAKSADEDEAPCGQGKYNSSADLCAQWKAADAAADSAWWAWVAAISTIVSTAAVLIAIGLTYQSNAIARDTAKRQLRAYVNVSTATIERRDGGNEFVVTAHFINAGQTPAHAVKVVGESYADDYPEGKRTNFPEPYEGYECMIGAGDTVAASYKITASDGDMALQQIYAGQTGLYIHGIIEYSDIFNERHYTKFRYVYGGRVATSVGMVMHAAAKGNEAT